MTNPDRDPRTGGRPYVVVGILFTVMLHGGVLGGYWFAHAHAASGPSLGPATFIDAALVKFGKPRDLSFLPHKQGRQKTTGPAEGLKIATSEKAPAHPSDKQEHPEKTDPLKRINDAHRFTDEPEGHQDVGEGSPTGSTSGTATEARGDPYIQQIIAQVGDAWHVPTTIKESELGALKATVCLTIAPSGAVTHFEFRVPSKSSQFDSSLQAALGTLKKLPPPPDRFAAAAAAGLLCPNFYYTK